MGTIKRIWENPKIKYLILLLAFSTGYYLVFARSIIPPQTGWWQYMGWRITEGDLPYRDFFLFLPPYYVFFVTGLYQLFGNHFILYTGFGYLLTRACMWSLVYLILTRKVRPQYAAIAVFTGLCVTSSYLMDQVFDYNPCVLLVCVIIAYLFLRLHETDSAKKAYLYVGVSGALSGILLMTKQNVGIVIPLVCLGLIFVIAKLKGKKGWWKQILLFLAAMAAAILPGVVYLLVNGLWINFLLCITVALEAKSGSASIIVLTLKNFISLKEIGLALLLICCYSFFHTEKLEKKKLLTAAMLALGTLEVATEVFRSSLRGAVLSLESVSPAVLAAVALWLLTAAALCVANFLTARRGRQSEWLIAAGWLIAAVSLGLAVFFPSDLRSFLYDGIDFGTLKKSLLYVVVYLDIAIWLKYAYRIFIRKEREGIAFFGAYTIGLIFIGVSFTSATLEELYAVILLSVFVAYLLEDSGFPAAWNYWKNAATILVCLMLCVCSLSQKIGVPYEWHSWKSSMLYNPNDPLSEIQVDGLKGFLIPESDAKTYENIVALIEKYSSPDDIVYQFPNILLFNVLTERKTVYDAVPYFDVMPDAQASASAEKLWENPPDMVIWAKLSEGRWAIHEEVFRGGAQSGQRDILNWHDRFVTSNYRRVGVFDNNEAGGEYLEVYMRPAFTGGVAMERITITPEENVVTQYGSFAKDSFDKYILEIPRDVYVSPDQLVHVTLYRDQNAACNVVAALAPEEPGYYSVTLPETQRVEIGKQYSIKVEFLNVTEPFQIGVTSMGTAAGSKYCVFKGVNQIYNLCISCE